MEQLVQHRALHQQAGPCSFPPCPCCLSLLFSPLFSSRPCTRIMVVEVAILACILLPVKSVSWSRGGGQGRSCRCSCRCRSSLGNFCLYCHPSFLFLRCFDSWWSCSCRGTVWNCRCCCSRSRSSSQWLSRSSCCHTRWLLPLLFLLLSTLLQGLHEAPLLQRLHAQCGKIRV